MRMESISRCKNAIIAALQSGESLTIPELTQSTGFSREAIRQTLTDKAFVPDKRRLSVKRLSDRERPAMTYKLAPPPPPPSPLELKSNPAIERLVHDQMAVAAIIRHLARSGHRDAALVLAAVWLQDDQRIKISCERIKGHEQDY